MQKIDLEYVSGERVLEIRGKEYKCNLYDLKAVQALKEFVQKVQEETDMFSPAFLNMCKETIDVVLGKGSSKSIFKATEKSTLPYYLCNKLNDLYISELKRPEVERKQAEADQEIQTMKAYNDQMIRFVDTMKKAGAKYGIDQDRPAEKH